MRDRVATQCLFRRSRRSGDTLVEPPEPPEHADVRVPESTYRDRCHEDRATGSQGVRRRWDAETKQRIQAGRHPLVFEQPVTVDRNADHPRMVQRLARSRQPGLVTAASRMCVRGCVVNCLGAMLGDLRHPKRGPCATAPTLRQV
jgi:Cft2 family RNA processing exonuclease